MRRLILVFVILLAVRPISGCAFVEFVDLAFDVHDHLTDSEAKQEEKEEKEKEAKRRAKDEAREAARKRAEEEEIARKLDECREKYKDKPNFQTFHCQERNFRR